MTDPQHQSPRPAQAPHTDQASNGESMPSNAETAESLRGQADRHPGSDAAANARHADDRHSEDPTGIHDGDDDQPGRPSRDAEEGN